MKLTRKQIFTMAHKETKKIVKEYGVNYKAQLGICLKFFYAESLKKEVIEYSKEEVKETMDNLNLEITKYNHFKTYPSKIVEKRLKDINNKIYELLDKIEEFTFYFRGEKMKLTTFSANQLFKDKVLVFKQIICGVESIHAFNINNLCEYLEE